MRTLKRLGLIGSLIMLAWAGTIALDALRVFFPNSALRELVHGKPLGALYLFNTWGTQLTVGEENKLSPAWAETFDTQTEVASAQQFVDEAEVVVVVLPQRGAEIAPDALIEYYGIEDRVAGMETEDMTETTRLRAAARLSWPFLHLHRTRVIVINAREAFANYDSACHLDLLTAWARDGIAGAGDLERRCRANA